MTAKLFTVSDKTAPKIAKMKTRSRLMFEKCAKSWNNFIAIREFYFMIFFHGQCGR